MSNLKNHNWKIRKLINYWPILLFFLVMLWQHSYIYLYHDDYGYASLSYVGDYSRNIQGNAYSLKQMLAFLKTHYQSWGGRLIPLFSLLAVLRWNIWFYRVTQSVVLSLIILFSNILIEKTYKIKSNNVVLRVILIAFYGIIPIELHKDGTYWASAAVAYVWPFVWILGAGILLNLYNYRCQKKLLLIIILLAFLCIGLSQEQTFFVAFFMLIGYLVKYICDKRKNSTVYSIIISITALLIGFGLLMLSPGNSNRANNQIYSEFYSLNIFDRFMQNIPSFVQITFGKQNYIILLFWVGINLLTLVNFLRLSTKRKIFLNILIFSHLIILVNFLLGLIFSVFVGQENILYSFLNWVDLNINHSTFLWISFLLIISLPIFLFCCHFKAYDLLGLYVGGVIGQLSSLIIPTVNYRYTLILIFSLIPVLSAMLIKSNYWTKRKLNIILVLLIITSLINAGTIIQGYKENSTIHKINEITLTSYNSTYNQGYSGSTIYLQRLVNNKYSGAMPYLPGYEYINFWIKDYYMIPEDVILDWDNLNAK